MATSQDSQSPLILFAMKEELAAMDRAAAQQGWSWHRTGGGFQLTKDSRTFDIAVSGPGKLNVLELLQQRRPCQVINPGFAGSISRRFDVGQVARVTSVRCGPQVLEANALNADQSELPEARIVTAPAPLNAADKMTMFQDGAGDLVDMETFHILQYCREHDIPYLGLRVVSDNLEDELPDVIKESYDGRQFLLRKIIFQALFSSKTRSQLLQLRQSSQMASQSLAAALLNTLESL